MKSGVRYALAGRLGNAAFSALLATTRYEVLKGPGLTPAPARQVIYVLWHGRLLPLTYLHRGEGIATLISRSSDGEYITRVVEGWGYHTARGSSSKAGSAGLRELLRFARAGHALAITPDGPRGPRQKMKVGALTAAQLTGLPLVPVSAGTDRGWWFESWDRFLVPKPFARIRAAYGEPRHVDRRASGEELVRIAEELEAELNRLTALVDGAVDERGRGAGA